MTSTFNGQILIDKLAKLNSSQQSIETLSHWCIFHRKHAKQVVETWDRQFHCSPRDQRVSFLYLANDILQNSRRKGPEFVSEFWKVLPGALNDALENGDEFARSATTRLIDIWEERKVFGLLPQTLKEELLHRNAGRNGRQTSSKSKVAGRDSLEKIISGYGVVCDGPMDEDSLFSKCRVAIGYVEKVGKEMGSSLTNGQSGSKLHEELQGQNAILKGCIEQLVAAESSRSALISYLKEALNEQEMKLDQVRTQLMAARGCFEQTNNICEQLAHNGGGHLLLETDNGSREHKSSATLTQTGPSTDDDIQKAAVAVAPQLASSASSAQMLTSVLSALSPQGVVNNPVPEGSADCSSEKRAKLENGLSSSYVPPLPPQPRAPHLDTLQHTVPNMFSHLHSALPPLSSSPHSGISMLPAPPLPTTPPPPQPPPPPVQFAQPSATMTYSSYNFGNIALQPPLSGYSMVSSYAQPSSHQNFQSTEGGYFNQPTMPTGPSISRQQNQV